MLVTLAKTTKPVIAYKIFAGGQMLEKHDDASRKDVILGVYEEVFSALKPQDMAAVGVFQRDQDQLQENARLLDQWYQSRNQ